MKNSNFLLLALAAVSGLGAPWETATAETARGRDGPAVIQHEGALLRQLEQTGLVRLQRAAFLLEQDQDGVPGLRVWLENVSGVGITAAVVVFRMAGAEGLVHEKTSISDGRLIPGVHESPVPPGESLSFDVTGPFEPTVLDIDVDYLEFADGTTAGEDRKGMSSRIRLRREGAWRALQHLRRLLAEKGLPEVLQILGGSEEKTPPDRGRDQ